jgi:cation transport regulator ChaC
MESQPRQVWTFFYGSYMNFSVLREVDLVPEQYSTAQLKGWALRIRPLASIIPAPLETVHGIVATATHAELDRLYEHARDVLGGSYRPEAVMVETESGSMAALCYVSWDMQDAWASPDYVERILRPAREFGLPEEYLRHIESFLPSRA